MITYYFWVACIGVHWVLWESYRHDGTYREPPNLLVRMLQYCFSELRKNPGGEKFNPIPASKLLVSCSQHVTVPRHWLTCTAISWTFILKWGVSFWTRKARHHVSEHILKFKQWLLTYVFLDLQGFKLFLRVTWEPFEEQFKSIESHFLNNAGVIVRLVIVHSASMEHQYHAYMRELQERQEGEITVISSTYRKTIH